MKAIILAAGRGRRLKPLTDAMPKPLIKINGETLIERHLKNLSEGFFEEVIINLSYKGEQIEQRIGNGSKYGIKVKYSEEGNQPLETLGGILKAIPILGDIDQFVVVNGDIWTNYPFQNLKTIKRDAHIVLAPKPNYLKKGDFDLERQMVRNSDNSSMVFTGIAKYSLSLFEKMPTKNEKLGPLLRKWAEDKKLSGESYRGKWFDIGTIERLRLAEKEITGKA